MRKDKLFKKVTAIMLAAAMVMSAAGCGNKNSAEAGGEAQPAGTESTAGGKESASAAAGDIDTSEPYTITWAYIGATYQDTDLVEAEMNKILQPEFNCTIDIIGFSWGEYTQKLNLMLSGDEPLDMVPVIYGNGASYLNNGQIIDMKELIDKYGKHMKEVVGEDTLYVCNVGGKIYGVPVFKEYSVDAAVMLRKDLLEEAGFTAEDIHSIDDLGPVYGKVKENHPEMVMLAGRKGETPAVAATWCDSLSDGFGVIMPDDEEGKVVNYYETEQFKHNAEVIYEYAKKGYISKDCATMNDGKKPQVKAGTAFSYFTPTKPGVDLQDSLDTGYEMVYAPLTDTFRATSQMAWIGWGIGKNCKYPERVMQVLDYMYGSPELMNLFNWGIEGKHYVFADEEKGIITYPEGVNVQNKTYGLNMGYEMPNQTIAYVWEGNEPSIWEEYRKFNSADPLISTGFIFDNSSVLTEISALTNVRDKYIDAIGSGAVDPAEAIPEMNEALKKAGWIRLSRKNKRSWMHSLPQNKFEPGLSGPSAGRTGLYLLQKRTVEREKGMKAILIMMDTCNRHMLQVYNSGAKARTPNIDRLAERSLIFDSHFIASAPCMPARRDILTGRVNFLERGWGPIEPYDVTLPRILREHGIFTHIVTDHSHYMEIGGEGYLQQYNTWDFQRGQETDVWVSSIKDPEEPEPHLGTVFRQYQCNRTRFTDDADRPTPRTFAAAAEWLRQNEGEDNFFLTVEAFDPHEPFDASEEFRAMYPDDFPCFYEWPRYSELNSEETPEALEHLRNQYYATLSMADKWLGKLLDEVDRQELWKDTCIIFTSDHGHMLGEHGVTGKNRYHAWDEMSRIPLLVHMPEDCRAGERVKGLTQNVDLFPTLLEYFGIDRETSGCGSIHGRSWIPLLTGEKEKIRDYAVYGWFGQPVNITDGRYTYFRAAANRKNAPLYAYMAALTTYERYLGCDMPDRVDCGKFLKQCPIPVYRLQMDKETEEAPYLDIGVSRLYDTHKDPGQQNPLTDKELEEKMCLALAEQMELHDAPGEQYERLGLESFQMKNHI